MRAPKLPRAAVRHFEASGIGEDLLPRLGEYMPAGTIRGVPADVDGFRLRYFEPDGSANCFYRDRLLADFVPEGESKPLRYKQPAGTKPRLYMPPLLPRSWAQIAADAAEPLVLTEGEKKSACACIHGFATLGLGGVWSWKADGEPIPDLDLFDWRGRSACIVFDSDASENAKVTAARSALAAELKARGAVVRVADLPHAADGAKNGLDDYLMAHGADALAGLLSAAPEWSDPVAELNRRHGVVMVGGKCLILCEGRDARGRPEVTLSTPNDMRHKNANNLVALGDKWRNAFDVWMQSPERRGYEGIVFDPTGRSAQTHFNLWRGFAVEAREGDCSLYLDHILQVVCDGDEALCRYVLAWMADAVQNPGRLPGTAIALRGRQGTGKGMAASWFGRLFGSHFVTLTNPRHLTGNFNAHTKDALVLFADEGFWAGDKSAEGTLKAMVTEPTRMVEFKGKDPFPIDNYTRLLIASNHDWVVPAGMEERRFLVLDVSDRRMQDHDYFKALTEQMESGGLEALLHHLMHLDISGVNLRALPRTSALAETKVLSMSGVPRFWFECLVRGANSPAGRWDDEVECDRVQEMYWERAAAAGEKRRSAQTEFGMALKKLLAEQGLLLGKRRRTRQGGPKGQTQCYVWTFPPLEECRAAMSAALGTEYQWEDAAEPDEPQGAARGSKRRAPKYVRGSK